MKIKRTALALAAVSLLVSFVFGFMANYFMANGLMAPSTAQAKDNSEPLYWVAPMDANYRRDAPGLSPMGMDLVPVFKNKSDPAEDNEAGTVNISAQIENSLGVKTSKVIKKDLSRTLQSVGFLQYEQSSIQHYHVRVEGWVETLYINSVGDKIKLGQRLFDLYSPALVYAQEEYLASVLSNNKSLLASSTLKLMALGVDERQIKRLKKHKKVMQAVPFYASKEGYVSALNVREGMFVQPKIEVLATGNLQKIWVSAEIFESQASWLEVGQAVHMTLDAFPAKQWLGKVDYIYPVINATNRTVQARIVFDNKNELLKPNMFAQLKIKTKPIKNTLVVPTQAVIHSRDMQRVVLALGDGKFRSVKVQLGIETDGHSQILAGLYEGQDIVSSAQFLFDSESSIDADLSRMQTDEPEPSRVWVLGTVKSMGKDSAVLDQQAIKEWQWPAQNMSLNIHKNLDISVLKSGDQIGFCLDKLADGRYLITHIEKQDSPDTGDMPSSNTVDHSQHKMEMSHD